jgi:predicted metal-dependent peptidase
MRPNRRSGFENMGSIRRFSTNLLVAVDVSGSVSSKSLSHFYSIINRVFKYGIEHISAVQFDTQIKDVESFDKARKNIKILGRGGTNFQPVFDYVAKHPEYDGLIIFTDGYSPEPHKPKGFRCKVAWICDDKRGYEENKGWMKKTGRCCLMEI